MYNGDFKKGVMMFVVAIFTGIMSAGVTWFFISFYSAVDAYMVANNSWKLWQ